MPASVLQTSSRRRRRRFGFSVITQTVSRGFEEASEAANRAAREAAEAAERAAREAAEAADRAAGDLVDHAEDFATAARQHARTVQGIAAELAGEVLRETADRDFADRVLAACELLEKLGAYTDSGFL